MFQVDGFGRCVDLIGVTATLKELCLVAGTVPESKNQHFSKCKTVDFF